SGLFPPPATPRRGIFRVCLCRDLRFAGRGHGGVAVLAPDLGVAGAVEGILPAADLRRGVGDEAAVGAAVAPAVVVRRPALGRDAGIEVDVQAQGVARLVVLEM